MIMITVARRIIFIGIISLIITSLLFADVFAQAKKVQNKEENVATVWLTDGRELKVFDIKSKETPAGRWLGSIPKNISTDLYYTVIAAGKEIHKSIAFAKINFLELRRENGIMGFTVSLSDGGKIVCDLPNRLLTITDVKGKIERFSCPSSAISDVLISGYKVQDKPYAPDGFIGEVIIDGKRGEWSARFEEIKKIDFHVR
jgi:hypothetical protein